MENNTIDLKVRTDLVTEAVIGCAIEVHKELGPGLLESAYEEYLVFELKEKGLKVQRQIELPIKYKDVDIKCGYRMDIFMKIGYANQILISKVFKYVVFLER